MPPLRSLGLTPEEATELVSDGDEPLNKPAPHTPLGTPLRPAYTEYHGVIPKVQERAEEECETTGQAHVWVKVGKVGLGDHGLSAMDWGDTKCLRCGIPVSVPDFDYEAE